MLPLVESVLNNWSLALPKISALVYYWSFMWNSVGSATSTFFFLCHTRPSSHTRIKLEKIQKWFVCWECWKDHLHITHECTAKYMIYACFQKFTENRISKNNAREKYVSKYICSIFFMTLISEYDSMRNYQRLCFGTEAESTFKARESQFERTYRARTDVCTVRFVARSSVSTARGAMYLFYWNS